MRQVVLVTEDPVVVVVLPFLEEVEEGVVLPFLEEEEVAEGLQVAVVVEEAAHRELTQVVVVEEEALFQRHFQEVEEEAGARVLLPDSSLTLLELAALWAKCHRAVVVLLIG